MPGALLIRHRSKAASVPSWSLNRAISIPEYQDAAYSSGVHLGTASTSAFGAKETLFLVFFLGAGAGDAAMVDAVSKVKSRSRRLRFLRGNDEAVRVTGSEAEAEAELSSSGETGRGADIVMLV